MAMTFDIYVTMIKNLHGEVLEDWRNDPKRCVDYSLIDAVLSKDAYGNYNRVVKHSLSRIIRTDETVVAYFETCFDRLDWVKENPGVAMLEYLISGDKETL